jgi:hypothetical protein
MPRMIAQPELGERLPLFRGATIGRNRQQAA